MVTQRRQRSLSVYIGRERIGCLSELYDGSWRTVRAEGRSIGIFKTCSAAARALCRNLPALEVRAQAAVADWANSGTVTAPAVGVHRVPESKKMTRRNCVAAQFTSASKVKNDDARDNARLRDRQAN